MSNIVKIEHSYDLGSKFSNISIEGAWSRLLNYLQENKQLVNRIVLHKDDNKIALQSLDEGILLDIITEIDPTQYFKRHLIRSIKLNVSFDKDSKKLVLSEENVDEIEAKKSNVIEYIISNNDYIKNDVYFNESAVLSNYENLHKEDYQNSKYKLAIIFFEKNIKNIIKDNNSIEKDMNLSGYVLLPFADDKLIISEDLEYDESLNLGEIVFKYNNGETISNQIYEEETNEIKTILSYSNFKLLKTNIILLDDSNSGIELFKSCTNEYLFNNFLEAEYRIAEEI